VKPYYEDGTCVIYHGDCRTVTTWLDAAVMVTDPPYGIAYSSGMGGKFKDAKIEGDGSVALRDAVLALWGDRPALLFGTWKVARPANVRHIVLWEKGDHVGMGNLELPWRPNVEEIYVIGQGFAGHRGSSVLRYNAPSPNFTPPELRFHPTEKPLPLMHALLAKCPPGVVADPFMGAGSTLIAAKDLGRKAIGIEIEERYCEIAAERLGQEVLDLDAA
jgi:DNA modification methylase